MIEPAFCRIQSDAIVVSSQQVYAPGQIVIKHGRIVEITDDLSDSPDVRLDDCVLLPGLVNPHTHLEFSHLTSPLPVGNNFTDWIGNVLASRQQTQVNLYASINAGLAESAAVGVALIGDIVTAPWLPGDLETNSKSVWMGWPQELWAELKDEQQELVQMHIASGLPRVVGFVEQLGLTASRREAVGKWADEVLAESEHLWPERLIDIGLSPHAPYSTPIELCEQLAKLARQRQFILAMHVLESQAERQWLDEGTGPMAELLSRFGASDYRLPRDAIEQLIKHLRYAKSVLLIHGNYLTERELDCIAEHDHFSLVYCPRTHQHFGHQPYPLESILRRGIRLLLGTDSRSTNPDLNLWQEARTALRLHSNLRPTEAFAAITDQAATALHQENHFGSLQVGRQAALVVKRMVRPRSQDIEKLLEEVIAPT